jgi:hypothetical protein
MMAEISSFPRDWAERQRLEFARTYAGVQRGVPPQEILTLSEVQGKGPPFKT